MRSCRAAWSSSKVSTLDAPPPSLRPTGYPYLPPAVAPCPAVPPFPAQRHWPLMSASGSLPPATPGGPCLPWRHQQQPAQGTGGGNRSQVISRGMCVPQAANGAPCLPWQHWLLPAAHRREVNAAGEGGGQESIQFKGVCVCVPEASPDGPCLPSQQHQQQPAHEEGRSQLAMMRIGWKICLLYVGSEAQECQTRNPDCHFGQGATG